jgi:hypothetical protein
MNVLGEHEALDRALPSLLDGGVTHRLHLRAHAAFLPLSSWSPQTLRCPILAVRRRWDKPARSIEIAVVR